jgi:hypothetical protein
MENNTDLIDNYYRLMSTITGSMATKFGKKLTLTDSERKSVNDGDMDKIRGIIRRRFRLSSLLETCFGPDLNQRAYGTVTDCDEEKTLSDLSNDKEFYASLFREIPVGELLEFCVEELAFTKEELDIILVYDTLVGEEGMSRESLVDLELVVASKFIVLDLIRQQPVKISNVNGEQLLLGLVEKDFNDKCEKLEISELFKSLVTYFRGA